MVVRSELNHSGMRFVSAPQFSRADLAGALDRRELTLVYQPQMTADGEPWPPSRRWCAGIIRRSAACRRANSCRWWSGRVLIDQLGLYVLEHACRDAGWGSLRVAVNIRRAFRQAGFVRDVARVLDAVWFPADRLEIEIVESAAFDNPGIRQGADRTASQARRPCLDGRFRHRLFLAVAVAAPALRQGEDRQVLRRRHSGDASRSRSCTP